jgi:hypothetical protein
VKRDGKVWFIDVADDEDGRGLKIEAAPRRVPVHPALINAGFLKYVLPHWPASFGGDWMPERPPQTWREGGLSVLSLILGALVVASVENLGRLISHTWGTR